MYEIAMRIPLSRALLIVAMASATFIASFTATLISSAVAAEQPATSAVTQTPSSRQALEELLSPIALYPDVLLTQILAASVNSQEVLDGGNWLVQNENLQG